MKTYIGTKIVSAEPKEKLTPDGDTCKVDREDGYRVVYEDGYESWSPKEVFERCYREVTAQETLLVVSEQPENPMMPTLRTSPITSLAQHLTEKALAIYNAVPENGHADITRFGDKEVKCVFFNFCVSFPITLTSPPLTVTKDNVDQIFAKYIEVLAKMFNFLADNDYINTGLLCKPFILPLARISADERYLVMAYFYSDLTKEELNAKMKAHIEADVFVNEVEMSRAEFRGPITPNP